MDEPRKPFAFQPEDDGSLPIETAVFQALGAASTCWESLEGTGVFDSERAKEIGDALLHVIRGPEDRVTVYRDNDGQWRWRRNAAGNYEKIAASGEAFSSKTAAVDAAERANRGTTIVVNP